MTSNEFWNHRSRHTLHFSCLLLRQAPPSEHGSRLSSCYLQSRLACSKPQHVSLCLVIPGISFCLPLFCLLRIFCALLKRFFFFFFLLSILLTHRFWDICAVNLISHATLSVFCSTLSFSLLVWSIRVIYEGQPRLIVFKQGVNKLVPTRKWLMIGVFFLPPRIKYIVPTGALPEMSNIYIKKNSCSNLKLLVLSLS